MFLLSMRLLRPVLNCPFLRGRKTQHHLGASASSGPVGEPQASAESMDRRLREQQADSGSLFALRREQVQSRPLASNILRKARPPVLDQDAQVPRAPAAVHLDLAARRGVGGVV